MEELTTIGKIDKIEVKTSLNNERKVKVNYLDFSSELKKRFREYKQKRNEHKDSIERFTNPIPNHFFINNEEYLTILNFRDSILYNRSVDNQVYLGYILQILLVNDLKEVCKEFEIRGYSKLSKQKIIEFLCDNLSQEEILTFLKERELGLISSEIAKALLTINKKSEEKIVKIRIVNPDLNEVEITFETFRWGGSSFLSITEDNIDDPERDCICRIGSNMGFCSHFWIGFIYSLKKGFFKLSDWKLTVLPRNIKEMIKDNRIMED